MTIGRKRLKWGLGMTVLAGSLAIFGYVDSAADKYELQSTEKIVTVSADKMSMGVSTQTKRKDKVKVPFILQNPELPTGCEVVSLAMVLKYYGFAADKCVLSDDYLPKGEIGQTDFHDAFVGNPRDAHSYGCYAPAIVTAAKAYLEENDKEENWIVKNLTGAELEDLYAYIDKGIPVMVWGTIKNKESYLTTSWYVEGKKITWRAGEHCRVLTGYNGEKGTVWVNDPMEGELEYKVEIFEKRYREMGRQAVVIIPENENNCRKVS